MGDNDERRSGMTETLSRLDRIINWQEKHSGEGAGTTHDLINERLAKHGNSITRMRVIGRFIVAMWMVTVGALIERYWR